MLEGLMKFLFMYSFYAWIYGLPLALVLYVIYRISRSVGELIYLHRLSKKYKDDK